VYRASLVAFSDVAPTTHVSVFVRSQVDLDEAIAGVREHPGLVLYTLADLDLRAKLVTACDEIGAPLLGVLNPVVDALSEHLKVPAAWKPGSQHRVTSAYFDRIAALDFAIAHDDSALGDRLNQADVILAGVSRTSKTPTCIYLAHRGIKAANVPLIPKSEPDPTFFKAIERGVPVIGLSASPSRLAQVRSHRLQVLGADKTPDYAELDQIRAEVAEARLFFDRCEIPVIDVTRRSIEETAAEILVILRDRGLDVG
jgi:regulator of PEP synthase PpsR (kinase-PPPase family)